MVRAAFTLLALMVGRAQAGEIESFFDSFFAREMEGFHIPGAVITVVQDGEIVFSKGYGRARIETSQPAEPGRTLFRAASVSKLITATAVMQLYERWLLALDEDVNRYLKGFRIGSDFPQPVTLRHLLTHTGGFDGRAIGIGARTPEEVLPLGQYLARRMPPRVRPPGDLISYSNHGIALAGHIVERVSGVPFERYVESNIFRPLGMERSSFSLPPGREADLATGYLYFRRKHHAVPLDYLQVAPAGSLITTAEDMARFMIAHLEGGEFRGARILKEETLREMHRRQFAHHPRLAGFAYGFYERFQNGRRAILHDGDIRGFSSRLLLVPDDRLGFFLSYNRADLRFRERLTQGLFYRLYPARTEPVFFGSRPRAGRFTGSYRWSRFAVRSMEKINSLLGQVRVTAGDDGTLTVLYPRMVGGASRWVEVEPRLFRRAGGDDYLYFREESSGAITHMFVTIIGFPFALEKVPWFATTRVQGGLMTFFVFVFLSPFPVWMYRRVMRRWRKQAAEPGGWSRATVWLLGLTGGFNVAFLAVVAAAPSQMELMQFAYGTLPPLAVLLAIPLVTTPLSALLLALMVRAWRQGWWSRGPRAHYSLVTLTAVAYVPFLHYWNLLGFRY